ncbi:hypothetical protein [Conexibacter arvalis]|uniref:Protein activator of alkane oxidation PraB n=1 Tax=Conexibacter arvalis TaxID=912552 RepID=A0A840IK74_9ACTN|nr:hypothetical protein [Conexibacter arvalis]MBB4664328.1 hypothetical protein [Conexibacter arvalis]
MKKLLLSAALAVTAMLAFTSVASATIISPDPGRPATANGTIEFQGNILTATCSMTLSGTVATTTTVDVGGGSGNCSAGALTLSGFNWLKTVNLDGTWSLSTIRATVAVPVVGNCSYAGTIGGTWASDGVNTILTVFDELSSVEKTGGSPLCINDPVLAGTMTLLGVVTG